MLESEILKSKKWTSPLSKLLTVNFRFLSKLLNLSKTTGISTNFIKTSVSSTKKITLKISLKQVQGKIPWRHHPSVRIDYCRTKTLSVQECTRGVMSSNLSVKIR